jgi:hypothetical protein
MPPTKELGGKQTKDTYLHKVTVFRDVMQCSLVGYQHLTTVLVPTRGHIAEGNTLQLPREPSASQGLKELKKIQYKYYGILVQYHVVW